MESGRVVRSLMVLAISASLFLACSNKEEGTEKEASGESVSEQSSKEEEGNLSYVNEDFSFGVYFDESGTERTIELQEGQEEFDCYIIIKYPEETGIKAVQWKLVLPEGVILVSDDYYEERNLTLGQMLKGFSEGFPCAKGPSMILHTLKLKATKQLSDAVISIMPPKPEGFMGVVTCEDGYPMVRSASYVGVINPTD